jgi:Tfp pilus assembly protein PilZ
MSAQLSIFLTSRSEEENQILRTRLEPHIEPVGAITFVSVRPQGLLASADAAEAALIILNLSDWHAHELHIVDDIRMKLSHVPLLVMAKHPAPQELNAYLHKPGFSYLAKPFEPEVLIGIVRKFLVTEAVGTQLHRRFLTNQEARVEIAGMHDLVPSRIINLSKGGAFIEVPTNLTVKTGDELRVKLELKQVSREYSMPAKVVWTKRARSHYGIGVEFTGPGDVKKTILSTF